MTKTWKRWTESDDASLRTLVELNYSLDDIASSLNRTKNSVQCRCYALGLFTNKRNMRQVLHLFSMGHSRQEIAQRVKITADYVSFILLATGETFNSDLYTKEEIDLIGQSEETRTPKDLAEIIKRKSAWNIYMKARRMGVKLRDGRRK